MAVPAAREPESKNFIAGSKDFIDESVAELRKVTWPDYPQLKNATLVVLLFVVLLSIVIWLMDVTVRTLINAIMGIFGA
jgi:preprotein translocase subunit SecE